MVRDARCQGHRMDDMRGMMTAARRRTIAVLAAVSLGLSCGIFAPPATAQSITDRFKSLFGGKSDEPAAVGAPTAPNGPESELACPPVSIRAGASTYAVAAPGKQAVGNDLRYQATITRTARDCTLSGGEIVARIGIQGRVIAGPREPRVRSRFRCASRWCRAAFRSAPSPPRST